MKINYKITTTDAGMAQKLLKIKSLEYLYE